MLEFKKGTHTKHFLAVFLFAAVTFLVSYKVTPNFGSITFGDGSYFHNIKTSWNDIATTLSPNYLGQDQSNIIFLYFPQALINGLLNLFGFGNNFISYILFFGFFFSAGVVYYSVFYRISKNYLLGIFAGLFIVLNNLSIEHIAFGGALYYYSGLISFAILFHIFWKISLEKKISIQSILLIILNSLLLFHPFYFFIYLGLIFLYFIFHLGFKNITNIITKYSCIFLGILLAHSYWMMSFFYGSLNRTPENTYGGNLDNVFEGFKEASSYIGAVNFFQYFNFFSKNFHQTIFHYFFYFGIVAILILSIFYLKNRSNKKILIFTLISYLFFFNFALGPTSGLGGGIWMWFWDNISFFKFFRSFSRFLIIIIPLYLFYFSIFNIEWKFRYKNYIYIVLIIFVIFLNKSMFSGNLKGVILATEIPKEYTLINDYLENDKSENNIVVFPSASYESYQWSINENTDLIQQNYYLKDYLFVKPIIYERVSLNLGSQNSLFRDIFGSTVFDTLDNNLEKINAPYILVQKDLLNISSLKNIDYLDYENYFNSNGRYLLLEKNKHFDLYKSTIDSGVLNSKNISFYKINSTEYKLYISNINNKQNLVFLNNYNLNWKLYLQAKPSNFQCQELKYHESAQVTECYSNQKFLKGNELSYIWKKPIFNDTHKLSNQYANKWTIDPEYIKQNFSKEYYKENPDGSIDVEIVLYFKPQSYFYLGLIISGTTLIGCLGYLLYDWRKRRKYKNEPDGKISEKIS